jgi:DNA (cytosine-5)-methyltransferase 1
LKQINILNGHAGVGGNRSKWGDKHKITAVELNPEIAGIYAQNWKNDKVIIGDVMPYLKEHKNEFDFYWFSPPCQKHSIMMKATRHDVADYIDLSLYQLIIFCQHFVKGLWVVENVKPYYEPLIPPTAIIGRHYFWSNFTITPFESENVKGFITQETPEEIQKMKEWLGVQYEGNVYYDGNHSPAQILRNAVSPKTGLHVLNCALGKHEDLQLKNGVLF